MRVLRLYAPSLIGDHTLCYVHKNAAGESCINEVSIKIRYALAGDELKSNEAEGFMTLILPHKTQINDGDFLSTHDSDTVLRWNHAASAFTVIKSGFLSVSAKFSIWSTLTVAVLTISDKGYKGEREDTAGPELEQLVCNIGGVVIERAKVPDEIEAIVNIVKGWCDKGYNLILTAGGTGLSPRDVTPEALLSISEKTVPGFGEMMRMKTVIHTPRAFLTRGLAVIKDKTLIIAFPGSKKGAAQCFNSISSILRHGVETLIGISSECGQNDSTHSCCNKGY